MMEGDASEPQEEELKSTKGTSFLEFGDFIAFCSSVALVTEEFVHTLHSCQR